MATSFASASPISAAPDRLELPLPAFPGRRPLLHGQQVSIYCDETRVLHQEEHAHAHLQVSFHDDPAVNSITRALSGSPQTSTLSGRHAYLIWPGERHAVHWGAEGKVTELYFSPAFVAEQTEADAAALAGNAFLPTIADDFIAWHLVETLRTLCYERPEPSVRLLEPVALALGRRLFLRHGRQASRLRPGHTRLTPERWKLVRDHLHTNFARTLRLDDLASLVALSPPHFTEVFGHTAGLPPMEYQRELRLLEAHKLALGCEHRFGEIADRCGFADSSHLNREFKKFFGYPARLLRYRWTNG